MDSKSLLVKQYQTQAELLCRLLATAPGQPADRSTIEQSLRGTHLLGGSASLMDLKLWSELCGAYEKLLALYAQRSLDWDERIADVTSEFIEKAESVVSAHDADGAVDVDGVITGEEMTALIAELNVLQEECESLPESDATPAVAPAVEVDLDAPAPEPEPSPAVHAPATAPAAPDVEQPVAGEGPLPGVVAQLRASFQRLDQCLETPSWKARAWKSEEVETIRRELNTIHFCARSIEKVIGDKAGTSAVQRRNTLAPLRVALRDFASELANGTGRAFGVELSGDELSIDPRLLSTTALVLQSMITDVFSRSGEGDVHVDVSATDSNGALRWSVLDNGGNFIADSPLDHEDQLAFYPGLRGVIDLVSRHRGVLWVEPETGGTGPRRRFEFTLPAADTGEALMLWEGGPASFAVRATQVCAVRDNADAAARQDEYGEYLEVDGARVPLFQLDELYAGAPGRGDAIVVLGALEKRIAFYVPGQWNRIDAHVHSGAVPPWQGAPPYVAQVGERRVALLDADYVINGYHSVTGTMSTDTVSGGVPEDDTEVNPRQATSRVDDPAPPVYDDDEDEGGGNRLDVLIVEQSEAMRESLTDIISGLDLKAACVTEVDEALDIASTRTPRLVISEFRMPTMAAKRIIDTLGQTGSGIPVLVTTSQTGVTADLLVEKLGASGYLSKPLEATDVTSRVSAHLGQEAAR